MIAFISCTYCRHRHFVLRCVRELGRYVGKLPDLVVVSTLFLFACERHKGEKRPYFCRSSSRLQWAIACHVVSNLSRLLFGWSSVELVLELHR